MQMIDPQTGIDAFREKPKMLGQPGPAEEFSTLAEQVSPSFAQLALDQVSSLITEDRLERGGLRILTTLDFNLQTQVACASNVYLRRSKTGQEANILDVPVGLPGSPPSSGYPARSVRICWRSTGRSSSAGTADWPNPGYDS